MTCSVCNNSLCSYPNECNLPPRKRTKFRQPSTHTPTDAALFPPTVGLVTMDGRYYPMPASRESRETLTASTLATPASFLSVNASPAPKKRNAQHNCAYCGAPFTSRAINISHVVYFCQAAQKQRMDMKKTCTFCGWKFTSGISLEHHKKAEEKDRPPHVKHLELTRIKTAKAASDEREQFALQHADLTRNHSEFPVRLMWKCEYCNAQFDEKQNFVDHQNFNCLRRQRHDQRSNFQYVCAVCHWNFENQELLEQHDTLWCQRERRLSQKVTTPTSPPEIAAAPLKDELVYRTSLPKRVWQCAYCPTVVKTEKEMLDHQSQECKGRPKDKTSPVQQKYSQRMIKLPVEPTPNCVFRWKPANSRTAALANTAPHSDTTPQSGDIGSLPSSPGADMKVQERLTNALEAAPHTDDHLLSDVFLTPSLLLKQATSSTESSVMGYHHYDAEKKPASQLAAIHVTNDSPITFSPPHFPCQHCKVRDFTTLQELKEHLQTHRRNSHTKRKHSSLAHNESRDNTPMLAICATPSLSSAAASPATPGKKIRRARRCTLCSQTPCTCEEKISFEERPRPPRDIGPYVGHSGSPKRLSRTQVPEQPQAQVVPRQNQPPPAIKIEPHKIVIDADPNNPGSGITFSYFDSLEAAQKCPTCGELHDRYCRCASCGQRHNGPCPE